METLLSNEPHYLDCNKLLDINRQSDSIKLKWTWCCHCIKRRIGWRQRRKLLHTKTQLTHKQMIYCSTGRAMGWGGRREGGEGWGPEDPINRYQRLLPDSVCLARSTRSRSEEITSREWLCQQGKWSLINERRRRRKMKDIWTSRSSEWWVDIFTHSLC